MEDPTKDNVIVKDLIQGLLKAKKIFKMYPPNNPVYIKTAEDIHKRFNIFFEMNQELTLQFHQNEIISQKAQVYYNMLKDDNLALFFFKDGIREMTFFNGFTLKELQGFIDILNTDFEKIAIDDDTVTLLWEHDFEHMKYVVADEILSDEDIAEENKSYDDARNKAFSDDDLSRAYQQGLKPAEKEDHINVPAPLNETDFKLLKKEIEDDENRLKIDKIVAVLIELLYQAGEPLLFAEIVGFIEKTISYCVRAGDLKRASMIIETLRPVIESSSLREENLRSLQRIYSTINSKSFIDEIGSVIGSEAIIDETELIDFVKYLDKTAIPFFIQLLGDIQSIKGRRLIISVLSVIGKLDIKTFAKGLQDSRWYVVRNIITILGRIADIEALEYLTRSLSHPDQRVRKEAIKIIGGLGGLNMLPYLKNTLNDKDHSVRIVAARTIANSKSEIAKRILLAELSKDGFLSRDFTEKKEFYEFITRWQDREVKNFLLESLKKTKLIGKTKNDETRACAAYAAGILRLREAVPLLEKTKKSGNDLLRNLSVEALKLLTE